MTETNSFAMPNVGSRVRVTIKERNYYYFTYQTEPYKITSFDGTVIPSEKWQKPTTFAMTGDSVIRKRIIDISSVHAIEYFSGSAKSKIDNKFRSFIVKSKNNKYLVTLSDRNFECSCIGFSYHKSCKHIRAVSAKIQK